MKSLRALSVFAWLCPVFVVVVLFIVWLEASDEIDDIEFFLLLGSIGLLAFLQIIYTFITRRFLCLKPYRHEIVALDDFIVQEMEVDSKLVSPKLIMKIFCIICSLALACFVAVFSYFLFEEGESFVRKLTRFRYKKETLALWMLLFAYLTAVPAIIYNIRTLTMKWIKEKVK